MNPSKIVKRVPVLVLLCVCSVLLFLTACGGTPTPVPTPRATPTPRFTPTPTATPTPVPSPTPTTYLVAILNRRLTRPQIVELLRKEGTVTVAGWNYAARDAMTKRFQEWVQDEWGVEVQVQYDADTAPATYLQNVVSAHATNAPAPYDVVAIEENFFRDAADNDLAEKIFPSDLLSNAAHVDPSLHAEPYGIAFQSAATIAPIFHNDSIGAWFHDWKDLSDPRLKRRIALPEPKGNVAGLFLIGVATSLGKDYKNPAQMSEAMDMVCTQIVPNNYTITSDLNEQRQLLRENRVDVAVNWNLLARLEGLTNESGTQDTTYRPMSSGQPALNGYAWIPKGVQHPVLAQLWINWRLSADAQLPGEAWDISHLAWGEYHEGLLGESYQASIPEWIKDTYSRYYPGVSEIQQRYKPVDWTYYAAHESEWLEQYGKCLPE